MATGQLVPHRLPDGRVVQVPDYLVPPELRMPDAIPPPAGPDMRVAGPGGGRVGPTYAPQPVVSSPGGRYNRTPAEQAEAQAIQAKEKAAEQAAERAHLEQVAKTGGRAGASAALALKKQEAEVLPPQSFAPSTVTDPSKRVLASSRAAGAPGQPGAEPGGGINPLVKAAIDEKMRGGGGGGPRQQGMAVGSIKEERQPGKELLPELMWANGLAERPMVVDYDKPFEADAESPIAYKPMETGLTRGAEAYAATGKAEFDRQELQRQEQSVAAKVALAQQSELIDSQLNTIAERRKRVAEMQAVAEKRQQEANTVEPRSRQEIWESKGALAQGFGILAMALGGALQATRGGENQARSMIEGWLDKSVEGERYNYERKSKLAMEAKNDFARSMALYGDLEIATLETKNRKIASTLAMTQQMLSDKALDETAKQRGLALQAGLQQQYLQNAQTLADMVQGHVIKQEVNYKPNMVGGGGGGGGVLAGYEAGARMKKALDTISGEDKKAPANPREQAELNAQEADMVPLKNLLAKYPGADRIPGVHPINVASRAVRGVADFVGGEGSGTALMESPEERANKMTVERAALAYRHAVTGAGGALKEIADIDRAFAGARTASDLREAVRVAESVLAERRRLSHGGTSTARPGGGNVESEQGVEEP